MPYFSGYINGIEYVKNYYETHKKRIKEHSKSYYAKNQERIKEQQRKRYKERNKIKPIIEQQVLSKITLSFD